MLYQVSLIKQVKIICCVNEVFKTLNDCLKTQQINYAFIKLKVSQKETCFWMILISQWVINCN